MQATFKVIHVGPSVSVQDEGRFGHMRFGVSGSGAMDRTALTLANAAIGNAGSNPALEISLGGLTLECTEGAVSIAIVGGSFASTLNDEKLPTWVACTVSAGDTLKIRPGPWGSWCYLAFNGEIAAQSWLNSYSVHLNTGVCGKPLQQGDSLSIENTSVGVNETAHLADPDQFMPSDTIRVVVGPQERYFSDATLAKLFNNTFTISADYDRMGMRLTGCTLPISASLDMPSEPISRGSLQVPGNGDPICLMADHHTAGGYPKIATVISADQNVLAQKRSGDAINFKSVTSAEAVQIARDNATTIASELELMLLNKIGMTQRLWTSNLISGASDGVD